MTHRKYVHTAQKHCTHVIEYMKEMQVFRARLSSAYRKSDLLVYSLLQLQSMSHTKEKLYMGRGFLKSTPYQGRLLIIRQ